MRQHLWQAPDSVLRSWLRDGADGWRLDTSYELGTGYLQDLRDWPQSDQFPVVEHRPVAPSWIADQSQ